MSQLFLDFEEEAKPQTKPSIAELFARVQSLEDALLLEESRRKRLWTMTQIRLSTSKHCEKSRSRRTRPASARAAHGSPSGKRPDSDNARRN